MVYFVISTPLCIEDPIPMVPRAGLEPAQSLDHEILSLARIPISPPRPDLTDSPVDRSLRRPDKTSAGRKMKSARSSSSRLLKNAHLLRFPHPSSLRRTSKYASLLRISGALHLGIFEQSAENDFPCKLLMLNVPDLKIKPQ